MRARLQRQWNALPDEERVRWHAVALCCVLFLIHYVLLSGWFVEDAAITFTYAHHFASGEGWVAYPGGELVEGFSNPTWTVLLAIADFFFLGPWVASKLFGALFGVLTLPFAYRWALKIIGPKGLLPVAVPLLLAVSPQFVIWAAAGLENGLFVLLLTAGCVWLMDEIETGGFPWSAVALGLLGITRPEGAMYIAVAGGLGVVFAVRARGLSALKWFFAWAGIAVLPILIWQAYRMWMFAYPLPNTYYAKLQEMERFMPLEWTKKGSGWLYVRRWALESTYGFLLPLAPIAMSGLRKPRVWGGLLLAIVVGESLVPGLEWPSFAPFWPAEEQEWKVIFRVSVLAAAGVALPLFGLGRRGDVPRTLAWYLAIASIFFAIYAGGDWMKGYRWLNMAAVPLAVLTVDAIREVHEVIAPAFPAKARRIRQVAFAALFLPPFLGSLVNTTLNLQHVEISPFNVRQRVLYMQSVQERLHVDHLTNMEVDFGAQMWWAGDEFVDMAGLTDVPMGHHHWTRPFVREYVFQERKPDFAHVHAGWASKTGIRTHSEWKRDYLAIDHYATGRRYLHEGNFIRKDLIVAPRWTGSTDRETEFQNQLFLTGLELPAPTVAAGHGLFVELGWRSKKRVKPYRAVLFLSGHDRLVVQEVPPGYDWYLPAKWRRHEVTLGRHTLSIPDDMPPGDYDLGMVVYREAGAVWASKTMNPRPVVARGEVLWRQAVRVAPYDEVLQIARELRDESIASANSGDCESSEDKITRSERHLRDNAPKSEPAVRTALASCWAGKADAEASPESAAEFITRARYWDHRDATVTTIGERLADDWQAAGDLALEEDNLERGYQAWRRALAADPQRPWLRRKIEELRDKRHEGLKQ